jgi:hypothetical protein
MRIFLVLICSFALASLALGAQEQKGKKKEPKKGQPAGAVAKPGGKGAGKSAAAGKPTAAGKQAKAGKPADAGKPAKTRDATAAGTSTGKAQGKAKPAEADRVAAEKAKAGGKRTGAGKPAEVASATGRAGAAKAAAKDKPLKPQRFNLPKQPNTAKAPPVKFQKDKQIEGSQNWQGQKYTVFRNYRSEWHDRDWWHRRYPRVTFVFGAPYYWNAGYWFPAWGYYPDAYYAWDGPIYAYNDLPPDQVIANVQAVLQQQGYYHGQVDGLIGPLTRGALADYQRDHGLYMTSTIDQPTLESLGMA